MYVVVPVPSQRQGGDQANESASPDWTLTTPTHGRRRRRQPASHRGWPTGKPDLTGVWGAAVTQSPVGETAGVVRLRSAATSRGTTSGWIMSGYSPSRFGILGSSRLQARVLGQGSGTRSVDKQGLDRIMNVPADGGFPRGQGTPRRISPHCQRHYPAVYDEQLRRRATGNFARSQPRWLASTTQRRLLAATYNGHISGGALGG